MGVESSDEGGAAAWGASLEQTDPADRRRNFSARTDYHAMPIANFALANLRGMVAATASNSDIVSPEFRSSSLKDL